MDNFEYVKSQVKLFDVLEEELDLKRNGKVYKAICPFHDERTPSFTVYPEDQTFHCYGCQANGTVIDYYMYRENIKDAMEALEFIANERHLKLEGIDNEAWEHKKRTIQKNRSEVAQDFKSYQKEQFKQALDFFNDRGITSATTKKFGIGYSLPQSAVTIPFLDTYGNVVGISYRNFDEDKPKYVNSAEDAVFRKSNLLYGLDKARKEIREYVFIVEGYFDVLAMHEMGYPQTVAYCGQSITDGQAQLLSKYIQRNTKIYLIPDNDKTGLKNVSKNIRTLKTKMKNSISVIALPDGIKDAGDVQKLGLHIDEFPKLHHEMFLLEQELDKCLEQIDEYEVAKQFSKYTTNKMIRAEMADYLAERWNKDKDLVFDFMETEESNIDKDSALQNFSSIQEKYKLRAAEGSKGRLFFDLQKPDIKVGGMRKTEVAYLLGRSGSGKTTLGLNFIHNLIFRQQKNVLFISLELAGENIAPEIMKIHLGQNDSVVADLVMKDDPSLEPIEAALDERLRVVDESGQTVQDIENFIRLASEQFDTQTDAVVIDYFGYIKRPGRASSYDEYSDIARELKQIAKRNNCLMFVLAQTNRAGKDGSEPLTMDAARDTGAIEESGDYVFGVYRPGAKAELSEADRANNPDIDHEYYLQYLKNRWGGVGKDKLYFEPETKRITNFDQYKSRVYAKGGGRG